LASRNACSTMSVQAQPSGGAQDNQNFGERSAVNVVARGTMRMEEQ
jgi:hypothetical protein